MRSETILIVDDEKLIRWSLKQTLNQFGFNVLEASTMKEALSSVCEKEPDLILLDQRLPDGTGIDVLHKLQSLKNIAPVIMLTVIDRSDVAVEAMKLGAFDYITKPVNTEELTIVIEKALEATHVKRQLVQLLKEQEKKYSFHNMIATSPAMKKAFDIITKVAQSNTTTVLITGESGTGKELAARAIHQLSSRKDAPFMAVNCSALTETLIESELFGHEKGAFTDAKTQRKGIFELAENGTIFLDEIGDIAPAVQVKLLRVLEEKTFRRVGGAIDLNVDARIIAATNQSLEDRVSEGKFRTDLYYRVNVAHFHLPPVRERGEDVLLLAEYFLQEFNEKFHKHFKGLGEETKKIFLQYNWPGNVREIRNVVERAILLDNGEYVFSHHVKLGHLHQLVANGQSSTHKISSEGMSLHDIEKQALIKALEKAGRNQSEAARLLKISRDTLRYRLKKYGIDKK